MNLFKNVYVIASQKTQHEILFMDSYDYERSWDEFKKASCDQLKNKTHFGVLNNEMITNIITITFIMRHVTT